MTIQSIGLKNDDPNMACYSDYSLSIKDYIELRSKAAAKKRRNGVESASQANKKFTKFRMFNFSF